MLGIYSLLRLSNLYAHMDNLCCTNKGPSQFGYSFPFLAGAITCFSIGLPSSIVLGHLEIVHSHNSFLWYKFLNMSCNVLLLSWLSTNPTNQYRSFQHTLSSHTRFPENFSEGHPSEYYSKSSMFDVFIMLPKLRCILLV